MNCEQAEELLSAYLDDALEPGLSEQVRAHLETCEHCRAKFWKTIAGSTPS